MLTEEQVIYHMVKGLEITDPMEVQFVTNGVKEFGSDKLAQAFEDAKNGNEVSAQSALDDWERFMDAKDTI